MSSTVSGCRNRKTFSSGKGVLRAEREEDGLVGRRSLQLEIELATEALAEREAPCAIHPAAERGVDDELHPARLVEESLGDDRLLSRESAEHALGLGEVVHELACRVGRHRLVRGPAVAEPFEVPRRVAPPPPPEARDTASDNSSLRAGASPSQKGMPGGWPCASSTRTVPC